MREGGDSKKKSNDRDYTCKSCGYFPVIIYETIEGATCNSIDTNNPFCKRCNLNSGLKKVIE